MKNHLEEWRKYNYRKMIHRETDHFNDNFLLGYTEAILNLLGESSNGKCEDCSFSYETEYYIPETIYPEYGLNCILEKCWIESIKEILKE